MNLATIFINDEKFSEVKNILPFWISYNKLQFLLQGKDDSNRVNSGKPMAGLENTQDLVQKWELITWQGSNCLVGFHIMFCFIFLIEKMDGQSTLTKF